MIYVCNATGQIYNVGINSPYAITLVNNSGLGISGASQVPSCCDVNLNFSPTPTPTPTQTQTASNTPTPSITKSPTPTPVWVYVYQSCQQIQFGKFTSFAQVIQTTKSVIHSCCWRII